MKRIVNGVEHEFAEQVPDTIESFGTGWVVRNEHGRSTAAAVRVGDVVHVSYRGRQYTVEKPSRARAARQHGNGEVHAPMPGLIVDVFVAVGDAVTKGQKLLVLEAMKTQQTYKAPFDGTIELLPVSAGDQVVDGALLVLVAEGSAA